MSFIKFFKIHLVVLLFPQAFALGQFNPLHQAEKKMEQGKWGNAHQILIKALRKDTLNVQAELLFSQWFLIETNPSKQIDSAYLHSLKALHGFQKLSSKQKEKLSRVNADSVSIVHLRSKIDSLAFERAKKINTEDSYQNFIKQFQYAKEQRDAIELRDEVAFVNVLRQNSFQAFENYLNRYPQSHRAKEAKSRYERLLFEAKTADKKLKSYLEFVKEFSASPYKQIADKNIFELSTTAGTPQSFIQFIEEYPQNYLVSRARDMLFHIARESDEIISLTWMTDSLKAVVDASKLTWAPILKNGKYGFIDSHGRETLPPQFDAVKEEYKCAAVKDDILITANGLFSRSGIRLADRTSVAKDLGYGFLKVGDSTCVKVLHKSGAWVFEDCAQDASVLNGRFLIIKINGLIGLHALNGRLLLPAQWNSIEMKENLLILDRMGKKTICLPSQLALVADGNPLPENFVFDNVKALGGDLLLVSNGSLEGIINSKLEFVVPLERQSLYQMPFGLVRKINDKFIFTNLTPELENTTWESYQFYRRWLLLKNSSIRNLVDTRSKKVVEINPDSIWFANGLAFAKGKDSVRVHVNSTATISLQKNARITFIKSVDSIKYFFTEQKRGKTIFSIETGEKLFTADYDDIESLTPDIFLVTRMNKKGLVNSLGKILLTLEYDALILHDKNQVSLLKGKKFGFYDLIHNRLIKPIFDRNIHQLSDAILIAYRDGHYGLIDWQGKPQTKFEFDEIVPWRENVIWVKKGFEWSLIDYSQSRELLSHVKTFQIFSNRMEEKLAFVQQENYFGVLSNERGLIIPPSFSYITNLGTDEEPLYFTAKEVEEAGIVVVIYYSKDGKLLRKQVYEEEEYAHIVCPRD